MTSVVMTPVTLYRSTIGKKAVMAVTGLILWGYVVFHMIGNLKVFMGPEHMNEYADFIRQVGGPVLSEEWFLWLARVVLGSSVILHIVAATQLTVRNLNARPQRYEERKAIQASYASRTMRWGGVIILFFVVYHVLHLTTGTVHSDFEHGNVYGNVVEGFQHWWVSAAYIVAVGAVSLHLYHGTWSMFQTLGANRPGVDPWLRRFSVLIAVALFAGFVAVPIGVMTGVVA